MRNPGTPPLVTVFGGGGFIGRYVCEALFKAGARVRVAERNPRRAWFLQPLGSIGQFSAVSADLQRPATIAAAVEGADAVINLVGVFKGDLDQIHVAGAGKLAAAAKAAGASSFVHISAIGTDAESESNYSRTKALGEKAVRSAFPKATIIRPSVVFGPEDNFTNRFAGVSGFSVLPVFAPKTRFQPIYVSDLGQAIAAAALDPRTYGDKTFELGGPDVLTMHQLCEEIAKLSGQSPDLVDMPDFMASMIASFGFLPGAPLTRDQWIMLQKDNVPSGKHGGLSAFGISATPMAAVAPEWLSRFRKGGRFAPANQVTSAG